MNVEASSSWTVASTSITCGKYDRALSICWPYVSQNLEIISVVEDEQPRAT